MDSMRLFKRGDVWYIEFERGKKISLKTSDRRQAEQAFARLKKERLLGRLVQLETGKNITLQDFIIEYLHHREGMSPKTIYQDELSLRLLRNVIGGMERLRHIDDKKIDDFKSACRARGAKPTSINSYLRHIKAALHQAVEWKYLKKAPKIRLLPTGNQLPRVLTPEQVQEILKKAQIEDQRLCRILTFLAWTGCRR